MKAHFFDLDVILSTNSKVWLIDKTKPNVPIMKISESDFNLIKNGIYKSQGNSIDFGGHTYWIPTEMFETLKVKAKNYRADISNLAFSMQEFMNKELIENLEYTINLENILHLKNTDDDIYVICSRNNKTNYELMISKIEDKLKDNGLFVKKFYYISETFYNRSSDDISHKKVRLLLQHIVGLKTESDKFTDEKLDQYDELFYYDDEENTIKLAKESNRFLTILLSNTDTDIKERVKEELKSKSHTLYVNYFTGNKVNRFVSTKVDIQFSNLITVFESFKGRF
jgi:hypothetical protein